MPWPNEYSKTVFFQRPSQTVMEYCGLAPDVHPEQGELAHLLIMQHVSKEPEIYLLLSDASVKTAHFSGTYPSSIESNGTGLPV